jgi:hypothetical protein
MSDDDEFHGSETLRVPDPWAAIRMPAYARSTTPQRPSELFIRPLQVSTPGLDSVSEQHRLPLRDRPSEH